MFKKGDHVKCEAISTDSVYIVKLLENPFKVELYSVPTIIAKVEIISVNQFKECSIHNNFILEGKYYTSKKILYMNTALYKILNGDKHE